jgi:hypothetical protein
MRSLTFRGWLAVAAAGVTVLVVVLLLRRGEEPEGVGALSAPAAAQGSAPGAADYERAIGRRTVERGLERTVSTTAKVTDGTVQAAVMLDGWNTPIVAASEPGATAEPMRMWSIAKVVTAVALLRQLGWANHAGGEPSSQLTEAMHDAIVRSENCRQRRLVLGLQQLTGGPGGARGAVAEVLAAAGAEAELQVDVEAPESICDQYLLTQEGSIPDPFAPTLLLGTATWRIADLVRFLNALGKGVYGAAIADRLLSLMRVPKERSTEVPPSEFTADLDWGAGRALTGLDPAYKAGWGGILQGAFVAVQGAVVELPDNGTMALAVAYHPHVQPARDDPGLTAGPMAIERVMRAAATDVLERVISAAEGESKGTRG